MNRYVTVAGLKRVVGGGGTSVDVEDRTFYVVDLQGVSGGVSVLAECGNQESTANKIAEALNDLDGGPL